MRLSSKAVGMRHGVMAFGTLQRGQIEREWLLTLPCSAAGSSGKAIIVHASPRWLCLAWAVCRWGGGEIARLSNQIR